MNMTLARCGHYVVAVGAPGSIARQACESRTCGLPRCRSGLPTKFTDAECEAYCRLRDMGKRFLVDQVSKVVYMGEDGTFPDLVSASAFFTLDTDTPMTTQKMADAFDQLGTPTTEPDAELTSDPNDYPLF